MKNKKFWILYVMMIISFVAYVFVYEKLGIKINTLIDSRIRILSIIQRVTGVAYYIIEYMIFISMCKTEKVNFWMETVFLGLPAFFILAESVIQIPPFYMMFYKTNFSIPFGTLLLCLYIYRLYKRKCCLTH